MSHTPLVKSGCAVGVTSPQLLVSVDGALVAGLGLAARVERHDVQRELLVLGDRRDARRDGEAGGGHRADEIGRRRAPSLPPRSSVPPPTSPPVKVSGSSVVPRRATCALSARGRRAAGAVVGGDDDVDVARRMIAEREAELLLGRQRHRRAGVKMALGVLRAVRQVDGEAARP